MRVKLKNLADELKIYINCKNLADENLCHSFSTKELASYLNIPFIEAERQVDYLYDLSLLVINEDDFPSANTPDDYHYLVKSMENIGVNPNEEYLVIGKESNFWRLITTDITRPSLYAADLFTITDLTKEGNWVTTNDGQSEYPEDLNERAFFDRYFDGDLEYRYRYFKYLKKIGLLPTEAKELIDPRHEKVRAERVTKQVEKRQLREKNKSKYHFLAWLESKSILPEKSTDEQIIEAVLQTLKEIKLKDN